MTRRSSRIINRKWRTGIWGIFCATFFALAMLLAVPAHAGDARVIKSKVSPVYPEIAKRMKIGGEVRIEATVDADGKVKEVHSLTGNHMLQLAAEDAVRQWKFAPGDGESIVEVTVNFAAAP